MRNGIALRIEEKYGDLRKSEKIAADYILEHLNRLAELPLDRLGEYSGVSQRTVLRMVKAIGYGGYREFRYALVAEEARRNTEEQGTVEPMYGYSLTGREKLSEIPGKIVRTTSKIMEDNLKSISLKTYEKIIETLNCARLIDIYSVENSNVTARDLLTKLLYLGLNCRHFDDYYHQRISASNLTGRDAAIGISYSGCSRDTVDVMKAAKKSGAVTIVLTNFKDSLISRYADLLLCTSQEQLFYGDAIFSRTTQLLLVDMIYMGLLASDYNRYAGRLDKSSRVIRDKAYE